tara:strand:- start:3261 stop:3851 length:591 start_codon:yes stop_codon:yes gene_type:complete
MKSTAILISSLFASFALLGCTEDESSAKPAPATKEAAAAATKEAPATATKEAKKPSEISSLLGDIDLPPGPEGDQAKKQLTELSGFSDTLNSSWKSMSEMDYDEKASFLKKAKDLSSKASRHIGSLKQMASLFGGDINKQIIAQITKLTGEIGPLNDLIAKGKSITGDNWDSYQDQIGKAISSLSGGFSGIGDILN